MRTRLVVTGQLSARVREAVDTQGHTWASIQDAGGPSPASMTKIVKGDGSPISTLNCLKLDKALGWPTGTARRLADPRIAGDSDPARPTVTVHGGTAEDQDAAVDLHAIVENMERELDLIRRLLDRTDDEAVRPEA